MGILAAVLSGFGLALVAPWLTRLTPARVGWLIAILPLSITLYLLSFTPRIADGEVIRHSYNWAAGLDIYLSFQVDGLGLIFALLISGIGTLIMFYGGAYLHGHEHLGRFYVFILMFMASMLGVVLSDNLITFFVFWELTSITSFLLIGFEHKDPSSRYAAIQAFIVTAAGGQALLIGLIMMALIGGGWEFSVLVDQGQTIQDHALFVPMLILIVLGAFTKSAQIPFHFWLPAAMAAPTPVSAYLHSATMVKAGIYLLARLNPTLGGNDVWKYTLLIVGAATMFIAAYLAVQRTDLKQLLAYSTVSVLGMLTMLIGLGSHVALEAALVYLVVHALYKGALFLVAGTIDHETGTREIGQLGGLGRIMPFTAIGAAIAAVSMAGIPPLFGFIGKELVYEASLDLENYAFILVAVAVATNVLMVAIAGITGIHPFTGKQKETPHHPHEAPIAFWLGPVFLGILGIAFGVVPSVIDSTLVAPAVSAVAGESVEVSLYLWHGFNLVLVLSIITVALGFVLYLGRNTLRQVTSQTMALGRFGAERAYDRSLDLVDAIARVQTQVLQSGYLRYYLITIIAVTVLVTGFTLLTFGTLEAPIPVDDVRIYEWAIAAIIVIGAITAVGAESRLAAVTALGVVGYGVATIYILYGAPDLAMTQVLIETLTVILFVLVIYRLPQFSSYSAVRSRVRDAAVAIGAGVLMTVLVLVVSNTQFYPSISEFHAEEAQPSAHGHNIVNVILVDFRAFDTLGEITVLAIAGIGVYALLRLRLWEDGNKR